MPPRATGRPNRAGRCATIPCEGRRAGAGCSPARGAATATPGRCIAVSGARRHPRPVHDVPRGAVSGILRGPRAHAPVPQRPGAPSFRRAHGIHERQHEIGRRRTFAIISHPDAGKTTLTEKLLLYGGAIQLAGAVKAKRGRAQRGQRLDGDGARARHLHHHQRAAVPLPRAADEPARHARPRRLQRGHLPHAPRGRRRGHAPRLREGRRGADEEALPRLQAARDADLHVREQDGPPGPRAVRAHRRGRERARHRRLPDHAGRSSAAASSAASTTGSRSACTCSTPSDADVERRASAPSGRR